MCAHLLLRELQNCNLLLNNHQQENVGSHTHRKNTPSPMAKEENQQDRRRGEIMFGIKPRTHQICLEGSNKTSCTPGLRDTTRDWARPDFECLNVSCGGTGQQWDRGSVCNRLGSCCMWHKSSWRRSPLAPPHSHWADDPQIAEQWYQRSSCTVKKVLGPQQIPQPEDLEKDREPPGNLTLKASGIWSQDFHRTRETDSWRA